MRVLRLIFVVCIVALPLVATAKGELAAQTAEASAKEEPAGRAADVSLKGEVVGRGAEVSAKEEVVGQAADGLYKFVFGGWLLLVTLSLSWVSWKLIGVGKTAVRAESSAKHARVSVEKLRTGDVAHLRDQLKRANDLLTKLEEQRDQASNLHETFGIAPVSATGPGHGASRGFQLPGGHARSMSGTLDMAPSRIVPERIQNPRHNLTDFSEAGGARASTNAQYLEPMPEPGARAVDFERLLLDAWRTFFNAEGGNQRGNISVLEREVHRCLTMFSTEVRVHPSNRELAVVRLLSGGYAFGVPLHHVFRNIEDFFEALGDPDAGGIIRDLDVPARLENMSLEIEQPGRVRV